MSEMNVSMRLTLQDSATAGLKGVVDLLNSLSAAAKPANEGLQALARRLNSIGTAAEKSGGGIGRMETAIVGIVDALRSFETKLGAAVDGFAQFGTVAKDAAASVSQAASAIGRAGAKLDGVAASTRAAKTEMAGFGETIKGMAAAWGALKIEHGLKKSVETAADMARLQAQMRSMGYSQDAVNYATKRSWDSSAQFSLVSARDAMAARLALMTATGTNNEQLINAALPQLLRNAVAYRANFNRNASVPDVIGNFGGIAELRGLSQTPEGLIAASNQALQVAEATGGRMKIGAQETVGRQYKYGGAQLVSDQGYKQIMALAEQLTMAGHEGGSGGGRGVSQMGTAFSMLLKVMNGGKMAKQTYAMLQAMDMWQKGTTTLATSTTQTATTGALRNALEGQTAPAQWVHDVLVPRMLAYAIKNAKEYFPKGNVNDPHAQLEALNKIAIQTWGPTGGVNVANLASMVANPEVWGRVENSVQRSNNAPTGQAAVQQLSPWDKGVQKLSSAFDNLKNSVGSGLLPTLTKVVNVLADILKPINDLLHSSPALSEAIGSIAAAFTALLSIKAVKWFLGIDSLIKSTGDLFKKLPTAASESGAEVGSATEKTASRFSGALGKMLSVAKGFAGGVAIAFTLYEAGENIKLFGVTINNHIRTLLTEAVGQFDRFFTWLNTASDRAAASFFGALSGAAKAVGASGLADWAKGHQATLSAAAATFQKNFDQRASIRNDMATWYGSPQAQPGYERPARGAPDSAEIDRHLQQQLAQGLESSVGRVPDMGRAGRRGHPRKSVDLQDLAQGWGMQDLHRATSEADRQLRADAAAAERARQALLAATQKTTPEGIRAHWDQIASTLASSANPADQKLAPQAQALGQKYALEAEVKAAKSSLDDLMAQLSNTEKVNAALVTSGVLTKDQAQAKTLADQRQAQPQLLAAVNTLQGLLDQLAKIDPAAAKAANALQLTRLKIEELGQGLTQFQQNVSNVIQQSFQGFFSEFMSGKKSWKQMGADFVNSILNGMNQVVSKDLASGLVKGLLGPSSGAGQALRSLQGSGGFMAKIGSWIGNLFGAPGAAGGATQDVATTALTASMTTLTGAVTALTAAITGSAASTTAGAAASAATGGGTTGGGGLFSWLGSLFGGANVSTAMTYGTSVGSQQTAMLAAQDAGLSGSSGGSMWSSFADWIGTFFGSFAVGADNIPHDMVAKIHQGEMIVPKAGAEAIRSGALGGGHTVNLSIHAMDSQSVLSSMDGIKRELATMLGATNADLNLGM